MKHEINSFKTLIVFSGCVALILLTSIFGLESMHESLVFRYDDAKPDYFDFEEVLDNRTDHFGFEAILGNQTVPRGVWKRKSSILMPRALNSATYKNMINLLEDFHTLARKLNSTPIMNRGMLLGGYY